MGWLESKMWDRLKTKIWYKWWTKVSFSSKWFRLDQDRGGFVFPTYHIKCRIQ